MRGAWTPQGAAVNSDTDSQSGSSKSLDSSPSNSPYPSGHKKMVLTGSMDDLIEDDRDISHVKQLLSVPGTELVDPQSIVNVCIFLESTYYNNLFYPNCIEETMIKLTVSTHIYIISIPLAASLTFEI